MIEWSVWGSFVVAALLLLMTPGPVVCYLVARSAAQGALAGFVSLGGVSLGTLCHILGAAFGVSQLLESSPTAFVVMKYLGAGYLLYLGIQMVLSTHRLGTLEPVKPRSLSRLVPTRTSRANRSSDAAVNC